MGTVLNVLFVISVIVSIYFFWQGICERDNPESVLYFGVVGLFAFLWFWVWLSTKAV